MTIRHLKTFVKVSELGSISKTAKELCVAQPSISQTIKELEKYYNVTLFTRNNKSLELTRDGLVLLEKAKEAIARFDEFEALANNVDKSPVINMGITLTFGNSFLPLFVDTLKREFPNIDLYMYVDKTLQLQEKVLKGDIDFAVIEAAPTSKLIKSVTIAHDKLIAVKGFNYNAPLEMKLTDLINFDLLMREQTSAARKQLDYLLALKGIKIIKPRLESISNATIIKMCECNEGIAILPEELVRPLIEENRLQEINIVDANLERKIYLISHRNKEFTKLGKKVYKLIDELI